MRQGHTQHTLAEQETFRMKDVSLPNTTYEAELQLKAISIILDVVLGLQAPVSIALCTFCRTDWPQVEVHGGLHANPATYPLVGPVRALRLFGQPETRATIRTTSIQSAGTNHYLTGIPSVLANASMILVAPAAATPATTLSTTNTMAPVVPSASGPTSVGNNRNPGQNGGQS
ncbi:hypothetical protein ACA910_015586 [Epithemia clementina (nom. ined.)]